MLYSGNRLEQLAHKIAEVIAEPLSSPFSQEIIVVQSKGMEHWLSMQLAQEHGICANCTFPFPNRIMADLFARVLPEEVTRGSALFETDALAWRIMDVLPGFVGKPGFEALTSYLADDRRGVRSYQFSFRMAEMFDSYMVYRPDMLLAWEEGRLVLPEAHAKVESWQSVLWRAVCERGGHAHLARLRERFMEALDPSCIPRLPERLCLFGISHLPPFHLGVFHALSRLIPVHVFALNPCRQYWGDIRSEREIAAISERSGHPEDELYLEEGNSILAALGRLERELFDMLQELDPHETELFEDIPGHTLLQSIQADILDLRNPRPDELRRVGADDCSLEIHSCHGPMREVEVLRDRLLALMDEDPDLKPEEIVVMAPDIRVYAPYIQAVFDVPRNSPLYIPFTLSDRSREARGTLADVIGSILGLGVSRFEATKVAALLESEPVRRKFGLREEDLELILTWIQESGIRWGCDEKWKREQGLPEVYENTWSFGLDRLLLGYAMPSDGMRGFGSILPYDDMEGDSSQVLGAFLDFLTTLFARVRSFQEKKTPAAWSETLMAMLDEFFEPDEILMPAMQSVRAVFRRLADIQDITGFDREVDCEVVRTFVRGALERDEEGRAYLLNGVTFCSMPAMRSIPFKVVCLLGMNHDDFPGRHRAKGFNLICRRPRRGDCSVRNKDLSLFLEALLSARKALHISFTGQSIDDNSPIPPAVPVSILLDYLESGWVMHDGTPAAQGVVKKHCLQAFNPRYFTGEEGLYSFSEENAEAARSLAGSDVQSRVFIPGPIPEPADEWRSVDLGTLCSFFHNPCRFLLSRRLAMGISETSFSLEDREPIEPDHRELYHLRQTYAGHILGGADDELSYRVMKMDGRLPHGTPGEILFSRIRSETAAFVRRVRERIANTGPQARTVDVQIGPFTLSGSLTVYPPGRVVLYRPARTKAFDLFTAWIHHLVLCSLSGGAGAPGCYISRDGMVEFAPVENSSNVLGLLLEHYWEGMSRPLPFFPETSFKYASPGRQEDESREEKLKRARGVWEGTKQYPGEGSDLAYRICFQGRDALDSEFEEIASRLFEPLIRHRLRGGS